MPLALWVSEDAVDVDKSIAVYRLLCPLLLASIPAAPFLAPDHPSNAKMRRVN